MIFMRSSKNNSIKNVFEVQWMDLKHFLAFELQYSLFHVLTFKTSYRVDRVLFNFLFNSIEILLLVILVLVIRI